MEIKKEVLLKSKVKLAIKVPSAEMRAFFARAYNKLAPSVEVKGFRPGAAPKSMIISAIGENRLNSEILDIALRETYVKALQQEKLTPVVPPKINIKMLKDLTTDTAELEYEAELDLLPEVTLGNYKKIRVDNQKNKLEVSKEEVDQVVSHLARQQATFKEIERPAKMGDRIEIDFQGFNNGVLLENLSSKNYPIILGSKVLIPEFENQLLGVKKEQDKEFSLEITPPGETTKKKINFKVKVLAVQEVILPELNNEFAKKFQKETLEDLRKVIGEDVVKQKETEKARKVENQAIEELLKITKVEIPESLVEQEIEREVGNIREQTTRMGMTFENYLGNLKKTEEEFRKDLRGQAEKTIKVGLALGEIVKLEKIDSKDKEAGKLAIQKLISYSTE